MPDPIQGVPGAAPAPSPSPIAPPAGTPAAGDVPASGETEQAKANAQIALQLLLQSLPLLGMESPEGQAVHKAIGMLSKAFGERKSQDLAPAELLQLMSGMPDSYKQQAAEELAGAGGQPAGIPAGPHVPANLNP